MGQTKAAPRPAVEVCNCVTLPADKDSSSLFRCGLINITHLSLSIRRASHGPQPPFLGVSNCHSNVPACRNVRVHCDSVGGVMGKIMQMF